MTAEVAILNKSAIALAADSAATVGGDSGKIYNTVNKLFTLSKYHPVGVMIYGNADFMGVPFETIVKTYRETRGRKSDPKIEDYASRFTKYLSGPAFASEYQQSANVRHLWVTVFDDMADDIRSAVEREFRTHGDCTTKRQKQIVGEVSTTHLEALEKASIATGFEKKKEAALLKRYAKAFEQARNATLGAAPNKSTELALKKIAALAITKTHQYPWYCGVVVAGFGEAEVFPQYTHSRTSGVLDDVHKSAIVDVDGIRHNGSHSMILPFAQTDMVGRFMQGVDRMYENFTTGAMIQGLRELAKGIIEVHVPGNDEDKARIADEVNKSIVKQVKAFGENAQNYRSKRFVDPILDVVVSLPKEELANLAEALVNLTSIKRRVSKERETVGGPIDVAVISKGDGFVWIKRKHYFEAHLNPHFSSNYMRASSEERA